MQAGQLVTPVLRTLPKVWGMATVEGRWKPGSAYSLVATAARGALLAAVKAGDTGAFLETLATSLAKTIVADFERELKAREIEAYKAGKREARAEFAAREKALLEKAAAEAATGKAQPLWPKAMHAVRKADAAAAEEISKAMQEYEGVPAPGEEDKTNIPMQPVRSVSGWVQGAGLHEGKLAIQFRGSESTGPVVCVYPGRGRFALQDLLGQSSAGKWVWANVYHLDYQLS